MKKVLFAFLAPLIAALCAATIGNARVLDDAPFTYRLKVPAGAASCADHANAVAALFAAGSRATHVAGTCEGRQTLDFHGKKYGIDVVVVSYLSSSEQIPTRSVFGGNAFQNVGDATAGVFATYDECLSQLSAQQPLFVAETGVTPFAAYCTTSAQTEFYPGFSLTFESFGDLKARLYTFAQDGMGLADTDQSQVTRAASTAVTAGGGYVVWSGASRLFYYSDSGVNVSVENQGSFTDGTQCSAQLGDARAIFVNAGLSGVTSFCQNHVTVPGHGYITLMIVGSGYNPTLDNEGGHYDTFAECRRDLGRILQNAVSAGSTVYGGLCAPATYQSGGFTAHLYVGLN